MSTVKFYVAAKSALLGQKQITIAYAEGVLPKLAAKSAHTITVKTPKGASIVLTRGDSHAIWVSHQNNTAGFDILWAALSPIPGQAVELELLSVGEVSSRKSAGATVAVVAMDF